MYSHNLTSVAPAIHIVESRKYPLERMVTHKFPLREAEKAVKTVAGEVEGEDPIKVVLLP